MVKATSARATFATAMRKMLQANPRELQEQVEVPMILVKHRWKRNRNDVVGSVSLGFDDSGLARVPDVGHNRRSVEVYCKYSKGLAQIVADEEPKVDPPKPAAPKVDPPKPAPKPEVVKSREPEVVIVEDTKHVSDLDVTPVEVPKKKPTKKIVGKKKSSD